MPPKQRRISSQFAFDRVAGDASDLISNLQQQSNTTRPDVTLHGSESGSAPATGESSQVDSEGAFHTPASIQEFSARSIHFEPGSPSSNSSVEYLEDHRVKLNTAGVGQSGGSVLAAKIRQAVCQRTDTSKRGSSMESGQELRRLSDIGRSKSGLKAPAPDAVDLVLPRLDSGTWRSCAVFTWQAFLET